MYPLVAIAIILVIVVLFSAIGYAFLRRYRRFSGPMIVKCPETQADVGVRLDVAKAMIGGVNALSLVECTRWPTRAGCDQVCMHAIASDPERALVSTRLREWFSERTCAQCDHTMSVILPERLPSLLAADGALVEWNSLRGDNLEAMLATHLPICWDCAAAESFRRQYPELVLDNPWRTHVRAV